MQTLSCIRKRHQLVLLLFQLLLLILRGSCFLLPDFLQLRLRGKTLLQSSQPVDPALLLLRLMSGLRKDCSDVGECLLLFLQFTDLPVQLRDPGVLCLYSFFQTAEGAFRCLLAFLPLRQLFLLRELLLQASALFLALLRLRKKSLRLILCRIRSFHDSVLPLQRQPDISQCFFLRGTILLAVQHLCQLLQTLLNLILFRVYQRSCLPTLQDQLLH